MKTRIALVFAIAGLAAASVQAQDVMVKPQQTIQFKANAYGCLSKDKLDAADVTRKPVNSKRCRNSSPDISASHA
jgi:hypothetical protein